jgi:hypothetical protein
MRSGFVDGARMASGGLIGERILHCAKRADRVIE